MFNSQLLMPSTGGSSGWKVGSCICIHEGLSEKEAFTSAIFFHLLGTRSNNMLGKSKARLEIAVMGTQSLALKIQDLNERARDLMKV